ncbi:hypothetical protein CBL_20534, partial [Carabus blaptoides fortunei]
GPSTVKDLSETKERQMGILSKVSVEGAPIPEVGITDTTAIIASEELNEQMVLQTQADTISFDFPEATVPIMDSPETPVTRNASNIRRRLRIRNSSISSNNNNLSTLLTQNVSLVQQSQVTSSSTHCSHAAAKDVITSFDPEVRTQTMEKWLQFIDELARAYGWDHQNTTINTTAKLRGLAKTWYRALLSLNHDWHTWKQMLKTAFPSSLDYYQQLKVMTQRVKLPSESYIKYYYEQLALLTSLNIIGEKAVSCIIGGISDMLVQTSARVGNYSTPDELFVYL